MSSGPGSLEALSRLPAASGRKPVAAVRSGEGRAFALPEAQAPIQRPPTEADRASQMRTDRSRTDRLRTGDDMSAAAERTQRPERPARPDRSEEAAVDATAPETQGQGAAHRSARANAVAKGAGAASPAARPEGCHSAEDADDGSATPEQAATAALIAAQTSEAGLAPEAGKATASAGDAASTSADSASQAQPEAAAPVADPATAAAAAAQTLAAALAASPALAQTEHAQAEDDGEAQAGVETATDGESDTGTAGQPDMPVVMLAMPGPAAEATATAAPGAGATAQPAIGATTPVAAQGGVPTGPGTTVETATSQGQALSDKDKSAAGLSAAPSEAGATASQPGTEAAVPKVEASPATASAPPVIPQVRPGPEALARITTPDGVAAQQPVVPESRPTPVHGVPMEIGFRSLEGQKRFDIRLDPGELGRVEVRLEISDEGSVKATLTVDRPETLNLMQRESRALERALEQAGFRPSDGSIDLRLSDRAPDRGQGGEREPSQQRHQRPDQAIAETESLRSLHPAILARQAGLLTGGVDLVI